MQVRPYSQSALEKRFWSHVQRSDGCWLWTAGRNRGGYGNFWFDERTVTASRMAWELVIGPIPKGACVLHQCDTPACVRPDHLFLGSLTDNAQDMLRKHRQGWANVTQCPRGHAYSPENTKYQKVVDGHPWGRQCRACHRLSMQKKAAG